MITSSPVGSPCVRNVFVIERADPQDGLVHRVQIEKEICQLLFCTSLRKVEQASRMT